LALGYTQTPKNGGGYAKLEFGLHLINGTNFNNSANSTADFIANPLLKKMCLLPAYFGIAHEKYGSLTFGKQWGVYYDIGGYTDNFSLFGGSAQWNLCRWNRWLERNRPQDNAVLYRNSIGPIELGFQSQLSVT
jgi:predicted porin